MTQQVSTDIGGLPPGVSNDLTLSLELSYEIDLWGKYRSGALAAGNDLLASRYYVETVRITVAADVANAYFRLRAADALAAVLEETQRLRADALALQRDRFDYGIIGEYDLRQAEAELSAVIADIARTRQAIAITEAAVATLTGRSPLSISASSSGEGAGMSACTRSSAVRTALSRPASRCNCSTTSSTVMARDLPPWARRYISRPRADRRSPAAARLEARR